MIFLLIDWPERAVPEGLVLGGHEVWVRGGPGDQDYARWSRIGDEIFAGSQGLAPKRADIVYVFRPLAEVPEALRLARRMGAGTLWYQSGRREDGERDSRGCWLSPEDAAWLERVTAADGMVLVWDRHVLDGLSGDVV